MTYIMFKKLSNSDDKHIKSGLRASLFLVPVFGIQYVFYIVPFDPFESCSTFLFVIHYILIITEALQGAMVAIIADYPGLLPASHVSKTGVPTSEKDPLLCTSPIIHV